MRRDIKRIVVHCSDSPESMDIGRKEINEWHIARGFVCIGYHKVVRRNGQIERGRDDSMIGAHVAGHNRDSLGICWVGRTTPTLVQYTALVDELVAWCRSYGLTAEKVLGHSELDNKKTCPNLDMAMLRYRVRTALAINPAPPV